MRFLRAAIAVLLVASVLAWTLLRRSHQREESSAVVATTESQQGMHEGGTSPLLEAADAVEKSAPDTDRDREPFVPTFLTDNPSSASIAVRVIAQKDSRPLPDVRVAVRRSEVGPDPSIILLTALEEVGDFRGTSITDDEGRAELEVPAGVGLEIDACREDGSTDGSLVDVPALRPGERRDILIALATDSDASFFGRIVDSQDGKPLAGASVSAVHASIRTSARSWMRKLLREARSAKDGSFEIGMPPWATPHLRIEANGYGLALLTPSSGHEDPDHALRIPLTRGANLDIRLNDGTGNPIEQASVFVDADGRALEFQHGSLRSEASNPLIPDESWTVHAVDGRCLLENLPSGTDLYLEVRQGGRSLAREGKRLRLIAGETRLLEWTIGAGSTLNVLVLDQDGNEVPNREIWLQKSDREARAYFQADDCFGWPLVTRASTDKKGRCRFHDVTAGTWRLGPVPEPEPRRVAEKLGTDASTRESVAIAPLAELIEVGNEPARDVVLRIYQGLYIRGRVLSSTGEVVRECSVVAAPWNGVQELRTSSDPDGSFVLGPLGPGKFTLTALGDWEDAASESVEASAGQENVLLRLRPGGSLRGIVADATTGIPCAADVYCTPTRDDAGGTEFRIGMMDANAAGEFESAGLEPGHYGLVAHTSDGRFGVLSDVETSRRDEVTDVTLLVSGGGRLRVQCTGSSAGARVTITSRGVPVGFASDVPPGKTCVIPVPAGSLSIEYDLGRSQSMRRIQVVISPGDEKEVRLGTE